MTCSTPQPCTVSTQSSASPSLPTVTSSCSLAFLGALASCRDQLAFLWPPELAWVGVRASPQRHLGRHIPSDWLGL